MSIHIDHNLEIFKTDSGVLKIDTTGSFKVPSGTTAQRPSSPQDGMIRYNTDSQSLEVYVDGNWYEIGLSAFHISNVSAKGTTGLVYIFKEGSTLTFKRLQAGGGVELVDSPDNIRISARRVDIQAGTNVSITTNSDGNTITYTINANSIAGFTSTSYTGIGQNIVKSTTSTDIQFYGITGAGDIDVRLDASALVVSAAPTQLFNVGTGLSIIGSTSGKNYNIRSIEGGNGIDIEVSNETIIVSATFDTSFTSNNFTTETIIPFKAFGETQLGVFAYDKTFRVLQKVFSTTINSFSYPETRREYVLEPEKDDLHPQDKASGFIVRKYRSFGKGFFVISENNRLYGCGTNDSGELGLGDTVERTRLTNLGINIVGGVEEVWQSSYASEAQAVTYALVYGTDSNYIWSAGKNANGQLGSGDTTDRTTWDYVLKLSASTTEPLSFIKSFSASHGRRASCIAVVKKPLMSHHALYVWGDNNVGSLGLGDNTDRTYATRVTAIVSADLSGQPKAYMFGLGSGGGSYQFSFVVTDTGKLFFAGRNNGQAGDGTTTNYNIFTEVTPSDFFVLDAWGAGSNGENCAWIFGQNLFTGNYEFRASGKNGNGQLGIGSTTNVTTWTPVVGLPTFTSPNDVKFAYGVGLIGKSNFVIVTADDDIYVTGYRMNYTITGSTPADATSFTKVPAPLITGTIVNAFPLFQKESGTANVAMYHCFFTDKGEVILFGFNEAGGSVTYTYPYKEILK